MTCAGYLLLNSASPCFVEMCTGVIVCSLVDGRLEPPSLPPLEPREMARAEGIPLAVSLKSLDPTDGTCKPFDDRTRHAMDARLKPQRLLQLSGYRVEVLELAAADDDDEWPLAFSFQVNTYQVGPVAPDGSFARSALHDSVRFTATDHATKNLWIKHITLWNRYGWRETVQVGATQRELALLEEMLQNVSGSTMSMSTTCVASAADGRYSCSDGELYRDAHSAVKIYQSSSRSVSTDRSTCELRRHARRRFYRSTLPGALAPPV
ncbi:unnamed protein product [Hyaloperonospora brassicae]|uniref:Uncharacterized protein n=1 Tax=Hyaloperonospora brassicae TaxID=162125 RepID=A0AAV0UHQ4_HYABA|nr:unnamed protein product [Hyaloperonospora brassicae]